MIGLAWGQTPIHSNACDSATSGWTYTDGGGSAIQQGGYWLVDNVGDAIISQAFNVSTYTALTLTFKVGTYGSGTNHSCLVEYSTDGGSSWNTTTFTSATPSSSTMINAGTWNLGTISTTQLVFRWTTPSGGAKGVRIDDILFQGTASSPTLDLSPTTLSGFTYVFGSGPSTSKTYTLSGSNLTGYPGNITITGSTNYLVSTDDTDFGAIKTVAYTTATLANTTIYVRLKAELTVGNYDSKTISNAGGGATTQNVTCSGSVTPPLPPDSPEATEATDVDNDSFTANWEASSRATGYELDVYSGTLTELVNTGFEGSTSFPDGWTQYSSYVQSNSSIAHTGSNYAGMNLADDYFYTPLLASPTTISFWVSASSATASNTTKVQYSSDGNTWMDLASYASNGSDTGDVTLSWSLKTINANLTGDYYIRWFMSARSVGSAYYDDVMITRGSRTYVLDDLNVNNVTSYEVTGLDPETTYYYVVRAYDNYSQTSGNSNEIDVTTDAEVEEVVINADGTATGATIATGGDVPGSLLGPDTGAPAVIYTITATGTRDVTVYRPTGFGSIDWYCWLNTPGGLLAGGNPIDAVNASYVFTDVNFDAKGDVVVIMNDNSTLPVELSSFTATLNAHNYVQLTWVTQTETGVQGYYIFRGRENDLGTAILVSNMIPATNTSQQQSYVFVDSELYEDGMYYYWLQNADFDGSSAFHGPVTIQFSTGGGNNGSPNIPLSTQLKAAYPNPFNPSTRIPYDLARNAEVKISIYNSRGQIVRVFPLGSKDAGSYYIEWNGKSDRNEDCATGVYYIRMQAGDKQYNSKAVLIK